MEESRLRAAEGPRQPFEAGIVATSATNHPFLSFFPSPASTSGETATKRDGPATTVPSPINWAASLAVQGHQERLRAWDRVATPAASQRFGCRQTIMRRTQICARGRPRVASVNSRPGPVVARAPEHVARRRKLRHSDEDGGRAEFGEPLTASQVDELWARAESTVLDRYLKHPSMNLARDVRDARLGRLRQCSGRKRSRLDEDGNLPDRGSFSLHLYARLSPLLAEAWKKLGLLSEKAAKVMAASQNANKKPRHPRRHLAFEGIPDLSTIDDVTEPECSQDVIPLLLAPAQVSPRKRKERLDAHLDNAQDRLREKMVKLSPSGSAVDGTSPIKPASPTTASEKPSPAHAHGIASTGRALSGALFTSAEPITSSPVQSPTKTFRVPSLSPTTFLSTTDHSASENVTQPAESPIRRPGAPTPSRWARANPTTPLPHDTHLPTTPGSKLIDTDVAKLTDSIPRSVEKPVSTPTHWEREPTAFDFDNQSGISTPLGSDSRMSFIGASQLTSTPASEPGRRLVERRRRKSEPLMQKHLMKMQRSRRQSMGPSKLHDLQEEATSALDARQKKIELGSNSATKATLPLP